MSRAWVVVDLAFGDAGKGTITDFLVRDTGAKLVVRWNGGAQAGHTVVTDDGRAHTFSQFGAGTFVPGLHTHLAETVVVHPSALLVEARHLEKVGVNDALERLTIAESARIITPFHQAANRARELLRGAARHGSCGVGVGETVRDGLEHPNEMLQARDLRENTRLHKQLERTRERLGASLHEEFAVLGEAHPELRIFTDPDITQRWIDFVQPISKNIVPDAWLSAWKEDIVLEGAQGILLDESVGFHPHTTWSDCTTTAANRLLQTHGFSGEIKRLGVLRTYLTRHGEGPFPTEEAALKPSLPEPHNSSESWQGNFRIGYPDMVLARYAIRVSGGVDALVLTHLDRLSAITHISAAYNDAADPRLFRHNTKNQAIDLQEGDLDQQARLTNALRGVEPILKPTAPNEEEFLEYLESELLTPISLTSAGPTAAQKCWRRMLGD